MAVCITRLVGVGAERPAGIHTKKTSFAGGGIPNMQLTVNRLPPFDNSLCHFMPPVYRNRAVHDVRHRQRISSAWRNAAIPYRKVYVYGRRRCAYFGKDPSQLPRVRTALRRVALWLAAAAVPDRDLLRGTERDDAVPALPLASEGTEIVTDYRAMGFTLGRHPLARLRDRLTLDRLQPADQLATLRSGQLARACGLVTVRQRPGTANGVLFMTLEDETGQVNVILWPQLLETYRKEALGAALLAVYGVWQAEGKVRHLIARKLVDRTELLGALPTSAREFC